MNVTEWDGQGSYILNYSQAVFAWAMTVVCLLGVLTNSIVLVMLKRTIKSMDSRPHYRFLMNLFVADWLMCFTNFPMFLTTAIRRVIVQNSFLCGCQSVLALMFATASILLLVCLSYDRFVLVIRQEIMSKTKSYFLLVIVWTLALVIGTMILIPIGSYSVSTSGVFCSSTWWGRHWGITHPAFSSFILFCALIMVTVHYTRICQHVRKSHNNIGSITRSQFHRDKKREEITANMRLLVWVFVANWLIYLFVILCQMVQGKAFSGQLVLIDILGTFFGFFNSTVNPVVYAFLNRKKFMADSRRRLEMNAKKIKVNEKIRQEMRATLPQKNGRVSVGRDNIIVVESKSRDHLKILHQNRRRHSFPNILLTNSTSAKKNMFKFPTILPKTPPYATLIQIHEPLSENNKSQSSSKKNRMERHRPIFSKQLQPATLFLAQSLNV